jgi:polar amino acid transport system substrate-binding protein
MLLPLAVQLAAWAKARSCAPCRPPLYSPPLAGESREGEWRTCRAFRRAGPTGLGSSRLDSKLQPDQAALPTLRLLDTIACGVPAALLWLSLGPAFAQDTPYVPEEWKYGRRQTGSTLQYCIDIRDPDLPVARKIGQAIAAALLLEAKPHELGQNSVGEDLDNLYRTFLETCDIYLGFKLIPDAYPQWLAVTRPYYRTSYVMVTANAQWNALADMPLTQAIGATIGTSADIRLIQYLQSLPAERQWSRFPMGSDELALRALLSGSIGAALVWGPSFWAMRQSDPALAKLRIIPSRPVPDSNVDVGATLLARESFLRSNVDQAIAALTADGTIQGILDSEKFPATPVK